ncbi:transcriptional regulator; GstR [Hyphomicrobium denitrificans 1NES1]|uniref:Transcriptional regulator GstR n=1 Tax=Hyphomicrobium denitrificans 1NES1 TaxID=670307 RepID=N0B8K1_9HYPH|nr:LysR family transcriptional regulator [Hyphomicrobium denitrificans]AGK56876.1 transcriptional regulator; GstR [Hyphomicrobium denitrificans 1NES1]
MDRFRAMNVFVAVAEAGSLSAAARQLGEPLTNVSRILSQLETHVACTLIDRTTRRMMLTDAGREYLKTCRQVLEELERAESRIAGQAADLSGEIAITAPVSFGRLHVLPVIAEFLGGYPRINTRLLLMDRIVDLMEEEIDVAIRIGELPDSGLMAMRVGTLRLVVCASPDYLTRCGLPTSIMEIAERDCVTFDEMPGGSRWIFKSKCFGRKAVKVRSRLSVNSAEAAVEAAVAGVGITRVLSYQARSALDAGLLKRILERFEDTAIPVHLVYRPTRSDSPRVREFVQFAAERLRAPNALR